MHCNFQSVKSIGSHMVPQLLEVWQLFLLPFQAVSITMTVCTKLPPNLVAQNNNNHLSHDFHGSGFQKKLSCAVLTQLSLLTCHVFDLGRLRHLGTKTVGALGIFLQLSVVYPHDLYSMAASGWQASYVLYQNSQVVCPKKERSRQNLITF